MLPLLRHPVPEVRHAAQAALEAIESCVTQQQRGPRLLAAGGIDAPSAAEALVRPASADQPQEIRLLALESLGTLAVAETLPFLIRTIQAADPKVAAAARAAIRRVHERAAPAAREADRDPAAPDPAPGSRRDAGR